MSHLSNKIFILLQEALDQLDVKSWESMIGETDIISKMRCILTDETEYTNAQVALMQVQT